MMRRILPGFHPLPFIIHLSNSIPTVNSPSSSSSTTVVISLLRPHQRRRSLSTAALSHSPPLFSEVVENEAQSFGVDKSKTLLKGMRYFELEKWAQSHGFRPGQALMLWKRLYGDNIWANCCDELEGLNKDFKKMLSEHAEFKALSLKDVCTASDGTRKELADFIYIGGWTGD